MSSASGLAITLKSLHQPYRPLVLANVYDILSARAVAALPSCKALATASYAVARANGTEDDDMDFETNLRTVRGIAGAAAEFKKPFTVDIQDAYGDRLEEVFTELIKAGIVGANLEDCDKATQKLYSVEQAVDRIQRALKLAEKLGVKDFVINARCDTLVHGGELDEVLIRGKAYLAAGATTVFVWGGSQRGVSRNEVVRMVKEFDGRLSVGLKMTSGGLTVAELSKIGVARISVGPAIQFMAMDTFAREAEKLYAESWK